MFKKMSCLLLMLLLTVVAVGCGKSGDTGNKNAVKWPKNVEIIVPAGAGGDSDFNARLFSEYLTKKLEPTFVVSNVNGNGGVTGTRQVKNATNDGSKVVFYHSAFVVNQLCGASDYGFDAYEFACIAAMNPGNVIVVNSGLGIKSLDELIAYSKKYPGKLKMAAQTGATTHAVALLLKSVGLDANIVDAGSASARLAALLGGHVDIILAAYGSVKDYVTEGTLVPLVLDGMSDLDVVGLKSINNLGYNIGFPFYYFFAFPKGTDPALVEQFSNAVREIVQEDSKYAQTIYNSYYQSPVYYNAEDGLKKFEEVYTLLGKVDFSN